MNGQAISGQAMGGQAINDAETLSADELRLRAANAAHLADLRLHCATFFPLTSVAEQQRLRGAGRIRPHQRGVAEGA